MGVYSQGKAELAKEKAKQELIKDLSPETVLNYTKSVKSAATETTETLDNVTRKLTLLKAQVDSIPDVGNISNAVNSLKVEVASLKDSVNRLVSEKAENLKKESEVLTKLKESLESAAIDQL
jgi:chromosome segregation ATPase